MQNFKIAAFALAMCVLALSGNKSIIVIDAGHGGWDPGKISADGHEERHINLAIADFLQEHLEASGAIVFRTRVDDVALGDKKRIDLQARASMATEFGADLFISIHQNAFPKQNVKGAQVFYYQDSKESKLLAEAIQARIKDSLDPANNMSAKGNDAYFLLKETATPAVIVECGFFTNHEELAKLITEDYQQRIAWAIYLGISDFLYAQTNPTEKDNAQNQ